MIKIALIEDEPSIKKEITCLIEQETDTEIVGWSSNVKPAVQLINSTCHL
jgi:two-component system LytT family response regulator